MILKNLSIFSILIFSSQSCAHNWSENNGRYENHNRDTKNTKGERSHKVAAFKKDLQNQHSLPIYRSEYSFDWNRYKYEDQPWYTSMNGFYTVIERKDELLNNIFVDASKIYKSLESKYDQRLTDMESNLTKKLTEALKSSNQEIENLKNDLSNATKTIKNLRNVISDQQKAHKTNLDQFSDKIQKLEELSAQKIDSVADNFMQSDLEIKNSLELQAELFDKKVSNVESNFNSFKRSSLPSYETEVAEVTKKVTELQLENDANNTPSTTAQNSTQWYKVKSANTYTNMHWKLINQQLSWLEAFNYCQENFRPHGRLAEPNNRQLYEEMRIWLKNSYKVLEEENYYFVGGKSGSADSVYGCDMADNYQWVSVGKDGPQVPSVLGNTPLPYASTKRCCVAVHGMYDIRATECTKHRFVCEVADIV